MSGRTQAVVAVLGLVGAGLTTLAPNPCDVETAYHCARIEADPMRSNGRLLLLNSARHSYVDLADPRHLEFAYAQWIGAFLDGYGAAGAPLNTLHIGGGGFTLPRYLSATRPGSTNRVLELDGELVALDEAKLGVRRGPDLDIWVGDARMGLAEQPDGIYDVVIGDAFGHLVVPWHLTTRELVTDIQRVLKPGGVYALNIIDYPPLSFIRAEAATLAAVFPNVALVAPPYAISGERGANFVLFASDAGLDLAGLKSRLSGARVVTSVVAGDELRTFIGDARVLTDDFAPVDQLLNAP